MYTKEIKTKKCSKCGRELSIDNFYNNKNAKDGLQGWCKECKNGYNQTYKQTNKQYINHQKQYQNQYRNQFKGYYLYIIQDKNNEIVYVGQTKNYYNRLTRHLSCGVDSTKELFDSGEWACIKYLDVSFVENEAELKALENELIELYQPRCNTQLNIIHDIDRGRLFSLLAQLHNLNNNNDWEIFRVNK